MFQTLYERWQLCDLWSVDAILYHAPCLDGFAALWALHQTDALKRRERDKTHRPRAVPAIHGARLRVEDFAAESVLLVDYCPNPRTLLDLARVAREVWIIDHHATADRTLTEVGASAVTEDGGCKLWSLEAADGGPIRAITNRAHSGAGLVWDLYLDTTPPPLIRYVQDRDLWRFDLPGTREFCAALMCEPFDLDTWTDLSRSPFEKLVEVGRHVLRYMHRKIEEYAAQAIRVRLQMPKAVSADRSDQVWLAVHATEYRSEIGNVIAKRHGSHAGGIVWWHDWIDGEPVIRVSLRATQVDVDTSEIAECFGGGGHKGASGFVWRGMLTELFKRA